MAGTDPIMDVATAPDLGLETRKEIQRLRKLLINPNEVHLFTRWLDAPGGAKSLESRWITDRYIMVNVTGSLALVPSEVIEEDLEWPDGGYKLTVGKGLVPKSDLFLPDSAGMLASIERPGEWEHLFRTDWSMADSNAKLMLVYTQWIGPHSESLNPYAINEEIWVAFQRAFEIDTVEPVVFEVCEDRPYRVSQNGKVVGYIASATFPNERLRIEAHGVAEVAARQAP